ncbi:MAG TPA: hypothetical protein VHS76_11460 [Steroidobacteraceae bacterium]|jgi:hypothetical protein|nr:hypothetical protein [Steroidobacteraceae bacterium]
MKNKSAHFLWLALLVIAPIVAHADYVYTFSLDQVVFDGYTFAPASFSFEAATLPALGSMFPVSPAGNVNGYLVTSVSIDGQGGNNYAFSTQPVSLTNPLGTVDSLFFQSISARRRHPGFTTQSLRVDAYRPVLTCARSATRPVH